MDKDLLKEKISEIFTNFNHGHYALKDSLGGIHVNDVLLEELSKLFEAEQEKTLKPIKDAWLNEGPMPSYHHEWQQRLKEGWPTLYSAIVAILNSKEGAI